MRVSYVFLSIIESQQNSIATGGWRALLNCACRLTLLFHVPTVTQLSLVLSNVLNE